MAHIVIRQHTLFEPTGRVRAEHDLSGLCVAVRRVATTASMLVILASLTMGILARTSGTGAVRLFGHEVRPVLSGSMSPVFRAGDAVVITPATTERLAALAAGDIIVFRVPGHESMVVSHRISKVTTNNQGDRLFTTKGDANSSDDGAMVDGTHVIGVVSGSVPYLGRVMVSLEQRRTLITFLLAALLASFSVAVARRAQQQARGGRPTSASTTPNSTTHQEITA